MGRSSKESQHRARGRRPPAGGGGRAAAASAAHSASRKKSSSVEVSVDNEARIRGLMEALESANASTAGPSAADGSGRSLRTQLEGIYEELSAQGFQPPQIQRALEALPEGSLGVDQALDWLCFSLDASDLPKQFASGPRSLAGGGGGNVKVRVKEDEARAALEAKEAKGQLELAEAAKEAAKAQREAEAERERGREQERKLQEAEEQARRKALIMQYAEDMGSSSSEPEEGVDESLEDWELQMWSDPRDVERRMAERARAKVPPEVRRQQIAEEWHRTKKEATFAKVASDKARQKAAGQMIRDLKQEMQKLGLSEADLEEPEPEAQSGAIAEEGGPFDEPEDTSRGGGPDGGDPEQALTEGAAAAPGKQEAEAEDEDEEEEPMGDLFGDDEEVADAMGCSVEEMQKISRTATKKQITDPWLLSQGYTSGSTSAPQKAQQGKKKPSAGPAGPAAPPLPKALLQQQCQRLGLPAPRFERDGYVRGDQVRYKVIVLPPPSKGPPHKPSKAALSASGTYILKEAQDGWDSVQEAQNAAAAYALKCLMPDQPLHLILPEPYSSLLRCFEEEDHASRVAEDSKRVKDEIIAAVLAQKAEGAKAGSDTGPTPDSVKQPEEQESWEKAEGPQPSQAQQAPREMTAAQKKEGREMEGEQARWEASAEGQEWLQRRAQLPVWQIRSGLLEALDGGDILVISGATGCGKTTQVPQYILELAIRSGQGAATHIICTQPRRIAAVSVAERVAVERGEPAPGKRGGRVGYHVRLDAATTKDTRLTFCTTGILLRRLASDSNLSSVSHVVVDEVHERTLQGDFLIALLKQLVGIRRRMGHPLKVVLMSATLDASLFAQYFGGAPVLNAEGRTFPVTRYFLEDCYEMTGYKMEADSPAALREWDPRLEKKRLEKAAGNDKSKLLRSGWGNDSSDAPLNPDYDPELYGRFSLSTRRNLGRVDEQRIDYDVMEELIVHIDEQHAEGAILVFLPGMGEINTMYERLTGSYRFRGSKGAWVLPLHSTVSAEDQRKAFDKPPAGIRKIVLATNIAETSLTIEDVVYVVDTGKLKERRYDPTRGMSLLVEDFVSRAAAKQRAGRAGRVRPGFCFSLFTEFRHENKMRGFQVPEMLRVPLEEMVLQIHLLKLGKAADFLASVLEPPPAKSVSAAITALQTVGALTQGDEVLTPLGQHIAQLPVDARIGKLLLVGTALGCLSPILTIAACLSYKSPFQSGYEQQQAMEQARAGLAATGSNTIASGSQSDHLVMVAAFDGWAKAYGSGGAKSARDFARRTFLSFPTLQMLSDMRGQFAAMMAEIGFLERPGPKDRGSAKGSCWADESAASWNLYQAHACVVKAALTAALYPNVAVMDDSAGRSSRPSWQDGSQEVALHPQSVNHMLEASAFLRPYVVYLEKMRTSRVFIRDCSVVSPMSLLLFGGELQVSHEGGYVLVGNWIRIRASAQTAVLVKKARVALQNMLERHVGRSKKDHSSTDATVMSTIVSLLLDEEKESARS